MPHHATGQPTQAAKGTKPIQSVTLNNTNVTLSGSDQITTFQTLASLLAEEQAGHKRTLAQLAQARQDLATTKSNFATTEKNLTIVNTRMAKAETELGSIICPFHTWNCKSRASCAQTATRKLQEKDERIEELEEDMENCDQKCFYGSSHQNYYQYQ